MIALETNRLTTLLTRLLLLTSLFCQCACALGGEEVPFKRFMFHSGISLEAPTTWVGFTPAMKSQIDAATQAAIDLSGEQYDIRQLNQLLDLRQPLQNSYARLILSVGFGERLTQQEVKALSSSDMRELEEEQKRLIQAGLENMTLQLIDWKPLERREINGKLYLVVRYTRSSPTPNQTTYVEMYQLHDTDKSVNFSLEYNPRDKVLWDPICRRTLASLRVED